MKDPENDTVMKFMATIRHHDSPCIYKAAVVAYLVLQDGVNMHVAEGLVRTNPEIVANCHNMRSYTYYCATLLLRTL